MKNVFLLTATILLTLTLASCKKSETDNNSQTQYSTNQLLLMGTSNPNDASSRAVWVIDSAYNFASDTTTIIDDNPAMSYIFAEDSLFQSYDETNTNTYYTGHTYLVSNDTIILINPNETLAEWIINSVTSSNLVMTEINYDNPSPNKLYFTKAN